MNEQAIQTQAENHFTHAYLFDTSRPAKRDGCPRNSYFLGTPGKMVSEKGRAQILVQFSCERAGKGFQLTASEYIDGKKGRHVKEKTRVLQPRKREREKGRASSW